METLRSILYKLLIALAVCIVLLLAGRKIGIHETEQRYSALIDSINIIANQKPDTVILRDTIRPEPVVKWYPKEIPVPVSISPTLNYYSDSLVTEDISIYVNDTVRGTIESRNIGYQLKVPREIKETLTITEKIPVIVNEPLKNEFYGGISLSQYNGLGAGIFVDCISKNKSLYGIEYGRVNNTGYFSLRYGIKF